MPYGGIKRFSSIWGWNNWASTCKNMNLEADLKIFRKLNSKWISDYKKNTKL